MGAIFLSANVPTRSPFDSDSHPQEIRAQLVLLHRCGWPRTWKELLACGISVGKEHVQKLMQLHGISAKGKLHFKVTTDSNHDLRIFPNLLNRKFMVGEPAKVGDIMYIVTDEGWLFLSVVIYLFSRQVEG